MDGEIDKLLNFKPSRRQEEHAITADNISDDLCAELLYDIDSGDFELNDWQIDFIGDNLGSLHFTHKQKHVIYDMALKFKLL